MSETKAQQKWAFASVALRDAYTDFILSRQAMNCTPSILAFYRYTAGKFREWIEQSGVTNKDMPKSIFMIEMASRYLNQREAALVRYGRRAVETALLKTESVTKKRL